MTPILDGSEDFNDTFNDVVENPPEYPTEWHDIDALTETECRQISEQEYELRTPAYTITLNREGFSLYRDDTLAGKAIFTDWCVRHDVVTVPRKLRDLDGTDYE